MDEEAAMRTSSGAACLCPLVSTCRIGHMQLSASHFDVFDFISFCVTAYREPYLFVTYFNSLDVIEVQGHASLG